MAAHPRTILITGGSSGIGAALALSYARTGVHLALTGRNEARLAEVARSCRVKGATVETTTTDVTDGAGLRLWIERLDASHPIDLVIANAGIGSRSRNASEDEAATHRVLAVNVAGVLNTVFPVLPRMKRRKSGQIALVSSLAAFRGLPDVPGYSASKAAVKALGEAWRIALSPDGIGVSVVCPGFVTTRMTAANDFPMPLLMSAERAASIIMRGLARNQARIAFPFPTATVSWLMAVLPPTLSDGLVRRIAGPRRKNS